MSLPHRFNRRSFLRALGVGTAALTLPILRAPRTRALDEFPLRCIFVSTHNGFPVDPGRPDVPSAWRPNRNSETDFDLTTSPILAPLAAYQDRLLLVENLHNYAASQSIGGNHQTGTGAMLTGYGLLPGDFCGGNNCSTISGWAGGVSVDQVIAQRIGMGNIIQSLQLGVRVTGNNNRHRLSYRSADDPMEPENSPAAVYDRLFGSFGLSPEELARIRRQRGSVLDLVQNDLNELQSRLGSTDRATLEAHAESIRELERQLEVNHPGSCTAPTLGLDFDPLQVSNFPLVSQSHLDLITTAFACDLTRVVTLMYAGGTNNQTFPWLGINEGHHSLSHLGDSDSTGQEKQIAISAWYAGEIASLMARLDAIPEGEGTMLDHTLIVWANALSKGNAHSVRDLKYVLTGGGGYFRTGLYVQYPSSGTMQPSHNDLLVSCANAMGLDDVTTFGHPEFCNGALPELI